MRSDDPRQPSRSNGTRSEPYGTRLLDRFRAAIRTRHYSRRTEKAYAHWIVRFLRFHRMRHPDSMGEAEISRFLSSLAVDRRVSASTQNQALSALLFLYRDVLSRDLPGSTTSCARSDPPDFPSF